jgi:hypothetical protein
MTGPSGDASAGDNFALRRGPPPLRVHHFLAVTVVAALLLSVSAGLQHSEGVALLSFFRSAFGVVYTIATAVATTLVLFGFYWRFEGRTFFDQPGHWLLVERSLSVGTFLLAGLVAAIDWTTEHALLGAWSLAMSFALCAVSLWAAIRVADTWLWRIVFVFGGVMALGRPYLPMLVGISWMLTAVGVDAIVAIVILMSAAVGDRLARRPRDWPHWVGVLLRLFLTATALMQYLWQWLVTTWGA